MSRKSYEVTAALYSTVCRLGSSAVLPEYDLAPQASWNLPQKYVRHV